MEILFGKYFNYDVFNLTIFVMYTLQRNMMFLNIKCGYRLIND